MKHFVSWQMYKAVLKIQIITVHAMRADQCFANFLLEASPPLLLRKTPTPTDRHILADVNIERPDGRSTKLKVYISEN